MLEAAAGDLAVCALVWWKRTEPENRHRISMRSRLSDGSREQWVAEADFPEEIHYVKYGFELTDQDGRTVWLNTYGINESETADGCFELL